MIGVIKSEFQKARRTSINKIIIIAPLFTVIFSLLLGGGQNGAYNWWYVLFLPGMLATISAQTMIREKNLSYKGLLLYPQDKSKIWLRKIIYISSLFLLSSLVFLVGIIAIGFMSESTIYLKENIIATILLFLTYLFQIPISLFLTTKFNFFVAVFINLGLTTFSIISFGTTSFLTFYPYGTPASLMVPVLHILPNGLAALGNSGIHNINVPTGLMINSIVFVLATILTTLWFKYKEMD